VWRKRKMGINYPDEDLLMERIGGKAIYIKLMRKFGFFIPPRRAWRFFSRAMSQRRRQTSCSTIFLLFVNELILFSIRIVYETIKEFMEKEKAHTHNLGKLVVGWTFTCRVFMEETKGMKA